MARIYKENDVELLKERIVFFDANILIYIFWPTNSWAEKPYSRIYRKLLKNGVQCCIDFIVISEVVNRIARLEYENYKGNYKNFKNFRNSTDGENVFNEIFSLVDHSIIENFEVLGRIYQKSDLKSYLIVDNLDFSDKAIKTLCKENNCVLLTNDSDFKGVDIDLLTVNKHLF